MRYVTDTHSPADVFCAGSSAKQQVQLMTNLFRKAPVTVHIELGVGEWSLRPCAYGPTVVHFELNRSLLRGRLPAGDQSVVS